MELLVALGFVIAVGSVFEAFVIAYKGFKKDVFFKNVLQIGLLFGSLKFLSVILTAVK